MYLRIYFKVGHFLSFRGLCTTYLGMTSPLYKANMVISRYLKGSLWLRKDKHFHMQAILWRSYPWNITFGRSAHHYNSRLFANNSIMQTAVPQWRKFYLAARQCKLDNHEKKDMVKEIIIKNKH